MTDWLGDMKGLCHMGKAAEPSAPFRMEVRLKSARDLFNSLDPSPLVERDLDTRVEEFIIAWAEEAPRQAPLHLVIHLPGDPGLTAETGTLESAVQTYFRMSEARTQRKLNKLLAEGRRSALIGSVFLVACMAAAQLVRTMASNPIAAAISEGLIIIGWVANWRPVSILLYEWRPLRKDLQILARLSTLAVELRTEDTSAPQVASGRS
ncbi:MAG: hypothetical protein R3C13_05550 [Hyphomonas sp.]|uniref:hypothetical protein n=1 Tax=Hyphomonas sp. TaxID=87 RepID=UPI003529C230